MKVEGRQQPSGAEQKRVDEDRQKTGRREAGRGEERHFSQVLDGQRGCALDEGGDERGRLLREGEVQREDRDASAHRRERIDGETLRGERREVERQHADRREQRGTAREEQPLMAAQGAPAERAPQASVERAPIGEVAGSVGGGTGASAAQAAERAPMEQVAREIVQAVAVGEDGAARKVVFLEVTIPGQGDLRVRLRRDGAGVEVRMRADNDGLARTLRQSEGELRAKGAEQGIDFTSITVVR